MHMCTVARAHMFRYVKKTGMPNLTRSSTMWQSVYNCNNSLILLMLLQIMLSILLRNTKI